MEEARRLSAIALCEEAELTGLAAPRSTYIVLSSYLDLDMRHHVDLHALTPDRGRAQAVYEEVTATVLRGLDRVVGTWSEYEHGVLLASVPATFEATDVSTQHAGLFGDDPIRLRKRGIEVLRLSFREEKPPTAPGAHA